MSRFIEDDWFDTIEEGLNSLTVEQLKGLVKYTSKKPPTRKADFVSMLAGYLREGGARTTWNKLDSLEKAAVAETAYSFSPRFQEKQFTAKYGKAPKWTAGKGYPEEPSRLCLFFYNRVMPEEMKDLLKDFVPEPAPASIRSRPEVPDEYYGDQVEVYLMEGRAQRELLTVLHLIDARKVNVSAKTLRPTAATVKTIAGMLEDGDFYYPLEDGKVNPHLDPIRAFAWPMIVQAGGLAKPSGTRLELTRKGRKVLSEPPSDTLCSLWWKWMKTTIIDELSRVDTIKGQHGKGKRHLVALQKRREPITEALSECPVMEWVTPDDFLRYIYATDKGYAVARDAWDFYILDQEYGSLGYEGYYKVLDDQYMLALLLEYAATMGLIDVALVGQEGAYQAYSSNEFTDDLEWISRYDGLAFFRLTRLGAYCIGDDEEYHATPVRPQPVLTVHPNLEVTAESNLGQDIRLVLEEYAKKVSDHAWQLDSQKMLKSIESGHKVDDIRKFLENHGKGPLPEEVTRMLDDLDKRTSQVHDQGLARLLKCDDPVMAELIASDSRTAKYCMRAGDGYLVVPLDAEKDFKRVLRHIGYLVTTDRE